MGEMDVDNDKVFVSQITRYSSTLQNNFNDIIKKDIAKPLEPTLKHEVQDECEFKPKGNKYYVPKKKSKLKVFTVRDIRNFYEKDIFETLPCVLERQQKYLLRKIRGGYFNDEDTKKVALKLLKSEKPLSRNSWQMLMNLNPKGHIHSSQYILWNGKRIQLNGSKGGKNKFICNYDINNDEAFSRKTPVSKGKGQTRRTLLRDSLNIRFKPGPLQKKIKLDESYQKYNVGEIKVINLPEIGLHVQPSYGTALDSTITTFLQNMRATDGTISEKWAEFSSSVLGKATEEGVNIETENSVIFNLNYKYDQKRILMRNNQNKVQNVDNDIACRSFDVPFTTLNDDLLTHDIKDIVSRMLDSVEINLNQNSMYSGEDEPREISNHNAANNISGNQIKEKEKKRKYCELDRLDVTVITISENSKRNNAGPCQQLFCRLGCVCDSLECAYQVKDHCGKMECMFGCNCDFSKFKIADSLDGSCSEFIPGLVYLDKKINDNLAKEEQKFHQTVIVTDDKSILLKSRRRNWKTSKKYADFYSSMRLRTDIKNQKFPVVIINKLNCKNIEPWCMVHNLYKCFCKGKFLQSIIYDSSDVETIQCMAYKDRGVVPVIEKMQTFPDNASIKGDNSATHISSDIESSDSICARVLPFYSRKYSDEYYRITNEKIFEMEKNDKKLRTKMMSLISGVDESEQTNDIQAKDQFLDVSDNIVENNEKTLITDTEIESSDSISARVLPFESRKYTDGYYRNKNEKILKLEKNDKTLKPKLKSLYINSVRENDQTDLTQTQDKIPEEIDATFNGNELLTNTSLERKRNVNASVSNIEIKKWVPAKTKLVKWLENNLTNNFLENIAKGNWTTPLTRPSVGKVALYPWNFILSRYRERKNLFLLSTQRPFRVYMAINTRSSFFDNCINISDVPISNIGQYHDMVYNLINNVSHDNFCILSGLSECWELVGTVNKANKQNENKTTSESINESILQKGGSSNHSNYKIKSNASDNVTGIDHDEKGNPEISKWFIMTIEDDVNEIRFLKKGFFVGYDSIIRSINVARKVGKTLRLSSHKCNEGNHGPRFGVYATPNKNAHTIFIGPYEEHEPLGIETAKNALKILGGKKTRGSWITVNKTDNLKVTNNPLLFLPSLKNDCDSVVNLDSDMDTDSEFTEGTRISSSSENADFSDERNSLHSGPKAKTMKLVKPIRIRKTDSFYHLGSQSSSSQLVFTKCLQQTNKIPEHNNVPSFSLNKIPIKPLEMTQLGSFQMKNKSPFNKPVAEIAPQIKINNISALCSNSSDTELISNKRKSEGMFVLKPEEINKRLANNYFRFMEPIENGNNNSNENFPKEEKRLDVEEFLDSSIICTAPASDVYVISDDEGDSNKMSDGSAWKNVWITCANIQNIGWISGRRKNENKLSFEFPGFDYSPFYEEEEALDKINQVFSRKVYIHKNIQPKWQVIENEEVLNRKQKLREEDLKSDFVLTRRGLVHKNNLVITDKRNKKDTHQVEQGTSSEGSMEVEETSGSEKTINVDELPNENNTESNITTVASTSIDADGNDQGIKIYKINNTDFQKEVKIKSSKLDKFIESEVENLLKDAEIVDDVESIDESSMSS